MTIDDKKLNFVIEIEFVDSTFTQQFNNPLNTLLPIAKIIPDSVIFETFIGSWALPFYERGQIGDWNVSNLGLQLNIDHYRCYRINDEFYLVESPIMPVRIDIAELYVGETIKHFFRIHEGRASGPCGNSFLIEYEESGKDPISSMELLATHFGIFKRDKEYVEEISLSNNVRYFDIKF